MSDSETKVITILQQEKMDFIRKEYANKKSETLPSMFYAILSHKDYYKLLKETVRIKFPLSSDGLVIFEDFYLITTGDLEEGDIKVFAWDFK